MPHLEPTYLRYIYDGLIKGSIHPENAAELPDGLIGMYEEAFDERTSVVDRQKLLQRFAIWALLKKEVSAAFVGEVLGESEDDIQEFISTYSAWFNSPESGKYQLYHERLKVYLLQKLSEGEVAELNAKIVEFLLQKVNDAQQNESVFYCFENLSFHLFLNGYLTGESALLAQFCLDNNFKKRQFELSGYFDWEEKIMALGVEYFSLKQDSICHQIVFEKTKIQFKKKDIDLILSLIRKGDTETVFQFFRNIKEVNLYARVEIAYFYFLSFFEIFEKEDWNFIRKKEVALKLLEIFQENFEWDYEYWLSSFVDVNISFKLHCYFEQYGLDYLIIAKLSLDNSLEIYDLAPNSDLMYLSSDHEAEGKIILKKAKQFYYSIKNGSFDNLIKTDNLFFFTKEDFNSINKKLEVFSKNRLLRAELSCISDDSKSFSEIYAAIIYTLNRDELSWDLRQNILSHFKELIHLKSNGTFSISGTFDSLDGGSNLRIVSKESNKTLDKLVVDGMSLMDFLKFTPEKKYDLLRKVELSNMEVFRFFNELSAYYQNKMSNNLVNLLTVLIIEFNLNSNHKLIEKYTNELISLINHNKYESEVFENEFFNLLLDFFDQDDIHGHLRRTAIKIKNVLIDEYFSFTYYTTSFVVGCNLINLFTKYNLDFPEQKIINQILDDLNFLINENESDDLCAISIITPIKYTIDYSPSWKSVGILNIYNKPYFLNFYSAVKRIKNEESRIRMCNNVYSDIINNKGLNHSTIDFFRNNSADFPSMYIWSKKALSQKLLEKNEELSYVVIKDNNDQLLERLLLNIVSKREKLKEEQNIQILKHYGLDWVIELDKEYERLISTND